jgi:hypothetical protein
METQKNDEKNIVLELKRQLGRMMVQVDYMYRNDREMSRLDLDILMEHTRDLYELLCDYQADNIKFDNERPDFVEKEINEGGEVIKRDVELEIETPEEVMKEPDVDGENDGDEKAYYQEQTEENKEVVENEPVKDDDDDDSLDDEDWEDEEDETFHIEPINEDDYEDSPMIVPAQKENPVMEQKPVMEDNSLAAKLQRTPVTDIRTALGINDKIMIINDLFKGSVERFNKSIDALNEFPTLSGARIYLSELQIELQWDVESLAYALLYDLVERRFI